MYARKKKKAKRDSRKADRKWRQKNILKNVHEKWEYNERNKDKRNLKKLGKIGNGKNKVENLFEHKNLTKSQKYNES